MTTEKYNELVAHFNDIYQSNIDVTKLLLKEVTIDNRKADTVNTLVETLMQNNNAFKIAARLGLDAAKNSLKYLIVVRDQYWPHCFPKWHELLPSEQQKLRAQTLDKLNEWLRNPDTKLLSFSNYIDEFSTEEQPLVKLIPINAAESFVAFT